MAIAIKPRGIARGEIRGINRMINAVIQRNGKLFARTGKVLFNNLDITSLGVAASACLSALLRKGEVVVAPPP